MVTMPLDHEQGTPPTTEKNPISDGIPSVELGASGVMFLNQQGKELFSAPTMDPLDLLN